jgi:cysteine-rich repeat protein
MSQRKFLVLVLLGVVGCKERVRIVEPLDGAVVGASLRDDGGASPDFGFSVPDVPPLAEVGSLDVLPPDLPAPVCGDGKLEGAEGCDDGNLTAGDGCSSTCTTEPEHVCPTPGQACVRTVTCGDHKQTGGEACDDGNTTAGDGCGATCLVEPPPGCGNGMVDNGEQCDDGNNVNCDGCSKICITEACGNGVKECNEVCDDGGTLACDGDCAADCSRPADVCGDRITECGEQCDAGDANGAPASACSPFCQTCAIGSGADCPCATDFDCAPTGRCGGLACVDGACSSVALPCPANDGNDCNGVETCVNNGECKTVTAASCIDDGDPCTDETCNVVGGCTRLPRSGIPGVSCRLDDIESAAGSASIGDLPTKLRAKILKFSGAAKTRLTSAAQETSVKRQRKLLKAAAAQLAKLLKVIAKGLKKHQISEVLGTRLHEQADGARGAVQTLRAGLTG